jgi:type VI secretion system secreted protein Hcp
MAATDFFLKIEGVEGESSDAKHKGEIDLESWSWGQAQSGSHHSGGGGGSGKVTMHDFHAVMKHNRASPRLMIACATGEHFKKAVVTCRKAGKEQQEYLKITLHGLLVSSYQTSGAGHGGIVPTDNFSLNFTKIEFEYREQKPDGTLAGSHKVGYCLQTNQKL